MKATVIPIVLAVVIMLAVGFSVADSVIASQAAFAVERFVITTGIEDREPVDTVESFPKGTERAYCFIEARNIGEDTFVTVTWYHNDTETGSIQLDLRQGQRWRTYAYKNLHQGSGTWRVELKDAKGNILETANFTVQ